jgi:hypothetical protein
MAACPGLAQALVHIVRQLALELQDASGPGAVAEQRAGMAFGCDCDPDRLTQLLDRGAVADVRNVENIAPLIGALGAVRECYVINGFERREVVTHGHRGRREADQFDDLGADAVRQREGAVVMQHGILFHLHDELARAGPGIRPIVQQAIERMIGRALLRLAALEKVQRQTTEHFAPDAYRGRGGRAAQRQFGRHGDVRRRRQPDADQRLIGRAVEAFPFEEAEYFAEHLSSRAAPSRHHAESRLGFRQFRRFGQVWPTSGKFNHHPQATFLSRTRERGKAVPDKNGFSAKPSASDLGLSRKDIHEARIIRDAENAEPGIVRRRVESGGGRRR